MTVSVRLVPAFIACLVIVTGCATTRETSPPPLPEGTSLGVPVGQAQSGAMAQRPLVPRISIAGKPFLGAAIAPVTIVEFMDYECPFCQGFARETFPLLRKNYIETGKVRYVARDFPLPQHNRARPAAIAAACAGEQGQYWEMREAILAAAGQLSDNDLVAHARRLNLDVAVFNACRSEERQVARLQEDFAAARAVGVNGTPSFLVGASAGEVAQGRLLDGDETFAEFEKVLAPYLTPGK